MCLLQRLSNNNNNNHSNSSQELTANCRIPMQVK